MWMTKDGITRHVSDREVQKFKDLGFKQVEVKDSKLKLADEKSKADKKADDKNGAKAQEKVSEL